jgi:hypothetical protein
MQGFLPHPQLAGRTFDVIGLVDVIERSLRRTALEAGFLPIADVRAKWFLTVEHIAQRLARYLPMARLDDLARRHDLMRRLYDRVVPLNPRDSTVGFLRPGTGNP